MKVRFWGTRGSVAAPGPNTVRYGGNTSCVQLTTDRGTLVVLDCGTGARMLGDHIVASYRSRLRGHIFLTHTHWDHIQGFPFFAPVFVAGNEWVLYGPADGNRGLEQALSGQMQYTYFPVELSQIGAALVWRDLTEGKFDLDGISVQCQYLNHPAVTLGYRFEVGGRTVVYCTDHEPFSPELFKSGSGSFTRESILHDGDRRHVDFLEGADLVIHDAQYTTEEYQKKRNWGHSTIDYVVTIALLAEVKQLALFHHDPKHDDSMLDRIQQRSREIVNQHGGSLDVFVAKEGTEIELQEDGAPFPRRASDAPTPVSVSIPTVLVVDNDPAWTHLVLDTLEREDYVLEVATDGQEALSRIEESSPDLVLLGMQLSSITGLDILKRLRCWETTAHCPVVMLTGEEGADGTEECFAAGANDYLSKPFTLAQLRARITEWLSRSAAAMTPT